MAPEYAAGGAIEIAQQIIAYPESMIKKNNFFQIRPQETKFLTDETDFYLLLTSKRFFDISVNHMISIINFAKMEVFFLLIKKIFSSGLFGNISTQLSALL